jgi:hypothetical protein
MTGMRHETKWESIKSNVIAPGAAVLWTMTLYMIGMFLVIAAAKAVGLVPEPVTKCICGNEEPSP